MADIIRPPDRTLFGAELKKYFTTLFGSKRTAQIASSLRSPGASLFLRTNTLQTTNEEVIASLKDEGVEAYIADHDLNAVAIPIRPTKGVPQHEKIVVADKASSENILLGSHLYCPGIKRIERFHEGDSITVVNPRGHIVGSGIAAAESKELQSQQHGLAIKITHPFYALPSLIDLDAYKRGLFYSQSLAAMIVAPVLSPQPGETIIDFCAAPGGKSTHVAQLTENQCRVIGVDRSEKRLTRLVDETHRLGITCIETFIGRAREFIQQHPDLQADRVLVDPPCTALGVRPKLYDDTTFARIRSTASYQRMILDSALSALRPGGILVYSTCTLSVEENEENIRYLMETYGLTLEKQSPYIGTQGLVGLSAIKQYVQRIYPDLHDLTGYFIAKMRKPE